ncbi:MAG: 4Fe-4S binding protein [Desulfarculaceae bacterium]|nr:4Fe-4S binding protein [Desulfarculaceae bacterium]MCF8073343.1 4Fe-4S binding protein [Desulfarculaceae bacterium]MCF8103221.1 4Fe-4S binding protein [Desulfarculaceae bacterium]MCF8116605.1 4Fe-4S binding protein [Desulfarculaceae bacterium]
MAKKKLVFSFPPRLIQEPVTSNLIRNFDLEVNLLRARIQPREQGRIVAELSGTSESLAAGMAYLEDQGVEVDTLIQEIRHYSDLCINCTVCTGVCPTDALTVNPGTQELVFDASHCIMCEACVAACSYGAMESQF